jgi:hypothetical protein
VKIKLDEDFDARLVPLLAEGGHDVETVPAERLSGSPDETIYDVCRAEGRTRITLDMDFANPFRFPPEPTEGIIVVRPPRPVLPAIRATLLSVLGELRSRPLTGVLWIVEPGRIRAYDPPREAGRPPDETDGPADAGAEESSNGVHEPAEPTATTTVRRDDSRRGLVLAGPDRSGPVRSGGRARPSGRAARRSARPGRDAGPAAASIGARPGRRGLGGGAVNGGTGVER